MVEYAGGGLGSGVLVRAAGLNMGLPIDGVVRLLLLSIYFVNVKRVLSTVVQCSYIAIESRDGKHAHANHYARGTIFYEIGNQMALATSTKS